MKDQGLQSVHSTQQKVLTTIFRGFPLFLLFLLLLFFQHALFEHHTKKPDNEGNGTDTTRPVDKSELESRSESRSVASKGNSIKRIIYIASSLLEYNELQAIRGMSHHPKDRLINIVVPVLKESIESILSSGYLVDAYLILGYKLRPQREALLRFRLANVSSLEIWDDATPVNYDADLIRRFPHNHVGHIQRALSRQHRFVVRDKLFEYDMFVVVEDDMFVTGEHVTHYLHMSQSIEKLQTESPLEEAQSSDNNRDKWYGSMTREQLLRLRPGFIRVEVPLEAHPLAPSHAKVRGSADLDFSDLVGYRNRNKVAVNASICCKFYQSSVKGATTPENPQHLIIWETTIDGVTIRRLPDGSWVGLLMTGVNSTIQSYPPHRIAGRRPNDPQLIAQPASWMMTRRQILELHLNLCKGSFLPPYDADEFPSDGLGRLGMEFWTGGLQMWLDSCKVQRIISLDPTNFSKHLIYHTSNNKQSVVPLVRQIDPNVLLGQLNTLRKEAQRELAHAEDSPV